jgi:hypothetical protein
MTTTVVVCKILVTVLTSTGAVDNKVTATGHVISSNESSYLADFSLDAVQWRGDYSKIIVPKSECVELK